MSQTRTVLIHLPSHLLLLCFLWNFHPRSFTLFSCLVLAVLTTRLTDSIDHPSARSVLAVATLVITITGALRTNRLGCCWISSRSLLCLLTLRDKQHPEQYVCTSKHLEHGGLEYLWAKLWVFLVSNSCQQNTWML